MSLLDALKQSQQQVAAPKQAVGDTVSNTASIQQGLAVRATGKDPGAQAGQPAVENEMEKAQKAATQTSLVAQQQAAQPAQMQQQAQAQQLEFDIDQGKLEENEKYRQAQTRLLDGTNRTLQAYENNAKDLGFARNKAAAEHLGQSLRLSNARYVDNLNRAAKRNRLDNDARFRDALNQSIFDEERALFSEDIDFRRMMAADDRQFNELVSNMNLDLALKLAEQDAEQANKQGMYQGVEGLLSGGLQAYGAYKRQEDK